MIELDNITVALPTGKTGATAVLRDISLRITGGDWITVVGPNGSGKTTLLKTIAGLAQPRSGRVSGSAATGFLLQEPDNQFVASTVQNELVLSVPAGLNHRERADRLSGAIERFGLGNRLRRNPHQLSGGEKQKLAFATVWLAQPDLVLLDEPTSYLDHAERERCVEFVRELNKNGVAVVWTTHSGADIGHAARVVALEGGRIVFTGSPKEFAGSSWNVDAPDTRATPPAPLADGEALVTFDGVGFAYDGVPVFTDIDLQARTGSSTGVTGPNGSGKSTLLQLVSGILEPGVGTIRRSYRRITEGDRQNVFHLFQNPERLFFAETVYEEVSFGLAALRRPRETVEQTVTDALGLVGLEPATFAGRVPFSLSLGEMRRLAFAIALALDPRLLVLDEPASSLDATGRAVLRDVITRFIGEGSAVVIATHDKDALRSVTHSLIEL